MLNNHDTIFSVFNDFNFIVADSQMNRILNHNRVRLCIFCLCDLPRFHCLLAIFKLSVISLSLQCTLVYICVNLILVPKHATQTFTSLSFPLEKDGESEGALRTFPPTPTSVFFLDKR